MYSYIYEIKQSAYIFFLLIKVIVFVENLEHRQNDKEREKK